MDETNDQRLDRQRAEFYQRPDAASLVREHNLRNGTAPIAPSDLQSIRAELPAAQGDPPVPDSLLGPDLLAKKYGQPLDAKSQPGAQATQQATEPESYSEAWNTPEDEAQNYWRDAYGVDDPTPVVVAEYKTVFGPFKEMYFEKFGRTLDMEERVDKYLKDLTTIVGAHPLTLHLWKYLVEKLGNK